MTFGSANGNIVNNSYKLRIILLLAFIIAFILLIFLRLFHLQVLNYEYYKALALNQHEFEKTILPKRGEIFLSTNKEPLLVATNIVLNTVYAVPKEIEDTETLAAKLALLLDMTAAEITEKINKGSKSYAPIKKQLTEHTSKQINQLKLPGIYLEPQTVRYYPEKNLASHVLGFVGFIGNERVGQYGIEGEFEKELAGSKGALGTEKDVAGRWITLAARSFNPALDGDNLYLTLDSAIQFKAQEVLETTVEEHGAEGGSVIVVDPKNGKILAMASFPGFDSNQYGKVADVSAYNNEAISQDYEPGSVFKPITMAAALNEGKVNPQTTYEDKGVVEIDDHTIRNSDGEARGEQNMTQVLEKSLNTGLVFVEQQLGHENFRKYVKQFGFGKSLEVELPGEAKGDIDNLNKKGDIFFATVSFGQGITVTPIQLITAYTAIANGGKMMKPFVVQKIVHPDGSAVETYPTQLRQVIESKTAATLSAMLVNVVENGHGKKAAVKGYYIAGKTGTAQVPFKDKPGYDPSKNIGSFIGFGPVDDPQFLMLIKINHPKDVRFAESTAAPAFGEIANFILHYLQVPPSRQ